MIFIIPITCQEEILFEFPVSSQDPDWLLKCIEDADLFNGEQYHGDVEIVKYLIDLIVSKFSGKTLTTAMVRNLIDEIMIFEMPEEKFNPLSNAHASLDLLSSRMQRALIDCAEKQLKNHKRPRQRDHQHPLVRGPKRLLKLIAK